MDDRELHELTAAYALDALDADEQRAYEEHLARCEQCRAQLAGLHGAAAALAVAVDPADPPPELRARILDAARAERPTVVTLRPRWVYPLAAAAAMAACLAIGFGIWAFSLHSQLGQRAEALRVVSLTGAPGSLVVDANRHAALVLTGLPALPAGKTYEAWVLQGGTAHPAGTFGAARKTVVVLLTRKVPHGSAVGVTIERAGGVAKPTAPPIITSSPA